VTQEVVQAIEKEKPLSFGKHLKELKTAIERGWRWYWAMRTLEATALAGFD